MKICTYFFWFFLFLPAIFLGQDKPDFYISNKGNDSYPGTSDQLPKKSIAGIAPLLKTYSDKGKTVKLGLKSGDVWEENLMTSYPIQLNTYKQNSAQKDFAVLDGAKEFSSGWIKKPGFENTYRQAIPYTGFVGYGINGIGSYSYLYVLEIDKAMEKTAPFTARRMLKFMLDSASVETTPGSFSLPVNSTENPMPVFIHTSDGSSPNGNTKYRYEVCVKDWAINSTYQENNRFENLWVRGFGAGLGMLPGGSNSYYNKVIFGPGAAIHHLVVRSGNIDHSLFLPGPKNTNGYAIVFYDTEGYGRHCAVKNSMFFDIKFPVYMHTAEKTTYGALEMENVVGFADSTEVEGFMSTSNADSVILNNVYADGYIGGYYYSTAPYSSITNCWFKDARDGIAYGERYPVTSTVNNVFIKLKDLKYVSGLILQGATSVKLSNSIIHLTSSNISSNRERVGTFVSGSGDPGNRIIAKGNIFICDIAPNKTITALATDISGGVGTSKDIWSNNVYVLLSGNMYWAANNAGIVNPYVGTLDEWKKQSGQDQNSLFFDLRNDPRGLKAIFVDPENGNYDLAETPEGKKIADLRAGMTAPINCFLKRPSYEEAADLIRNDKPLTVNACRNPCLQNTIRIGASFNVAAINDQQVALKWNVSEQQNIDHYELQRATDFFGFGKIYSTAVTNDSSYSFIDNVQSGVSCRYRLAIFTKAGGVCYSDIRSIKITNNKSFNIYPNPSSGKISFSMNGYVGNVNVTVTNSFGQPVMTIDALFMYRSVELNFANQPRGIYFLKVNTTEGTSIRKFLLQ